MAEKTFKERFAILETNFEYISNDIKSMKKDIEFLKKYAWILIGFFTTVNALVSYLK